MRELEAPAGLDDIPASDELRVLIVEDDSFHYVYVKKQLERAFPVGLTVEWARDVDAAITMLRSDGFDVCLLDFLLGGADAATVMSAAPPDELATAFIVVSAFEDEDFVRQALERGADDYLLKGCFNTRELERAIQFSLYRKRKMRLLRKRALYDPLTGLANRALVFDRVEEMRKYARRNRTGFALAVVDLDELKRVNDTHGHEAGDKLIRAVAGALAGSVRESDVVGRIGGDELLVALKDIGTVEQLARVCTNMLNAVRRQPLAFGRDTVVPSCSIGAALYPDASDRIDRLVEIADAAMYEIKRGGGDGWRIGSAPMPAGVGAESEAG